MDLSPPGIREGAEMMALELNGQTVFKALAGLDPANGGNGRYPGVARWTRHLDPDRLEPCVYGYHVARGPQILTWLAPTLYVAEVCSDHEPVDAADKLVTCRVRLTERLDGWDDITARLFAADAAEAALLGERASGREPDERLWMAVVAARRYARGEISAAAWSAAGAAAGAAAWSAAGAAAWSAAGAAAWAAARSAAGAAAWDTAWSAAGAAAWSAAWDALFERLCLYLQSMDLPPVEPLYGTTGKEQK